MNAGDNALAAMIASCRKMETLVADSMPALTQAVRAEMERTIAAGTTADGEQWQPTKQGLQPLRQAAKAVSVLSVNKTIFVTIVGPEARHHLGYVRGGRKRAIIPESSEIPSPMAQSLRAVLQQAFDNAVSQR